MAIDIIFEDRILKNPRLLRLKNTNTNEIIDYEIQDLNPDEIEQEGTEIAANILNRFKDELVRELRLEQHPIGSYFWTDNPINPSEILGGTWEQIKDVFLIAAGDKYAQGTTGGKDNITLKADNIPKHAHSIPALSGTTNSAGAHTHTGRYGKYGTIGSYLTVRRINNEDPYAGDDTVTNSAGNHTHTFKTNTGTTGAVGDGKSVNIMNPFRAAYCWKRTS